MAVVGLVGGVDVAVLLPVAGVGKPPVATLKLALKGLLTCNGTNKDQLDHQLHIAS